MTEVANDGQADVIVLGGGMVGVSTALALRERGRSVMLIDRKDPGNETSYGNAGILSSGSIFPLNTPSLWSKLPKYLTNGHPALRWDLQWAMKNPDWLWRFITQASAVNTRPRATALRGLIQTSLALHRDWIVRAGAAARIRETGWLKVWRSNAESAAREDQAMLAEFGIKSEVLDRAGIAALEPNLLPVYKVGLLHSETASVDSPGEVVKAYAQMLTGAGGVIRRGEVRGISPDGDGWRVQLDDATLTAPHLVVAFGPWSDDLLRPLGYKVPLAFERGYHQEYTASHNRTLTRPIHDADYSFVMTPMERGLRITTGVELTARDAPSRFDQLDAVLPLARGTLEFGEPVGERWRGARPTLPDSLPMIGPAPKHRNLWLCFGHQHIGFTTGTGSGAAIAALIDGTEPPFDLAAFAPSRYL